LDSGFYFKRIELDTNTAIASALSCPWRRGKIQITWNIGFDRLSHLEVGQLAAKTQNQRIVVHGIYFASFDGTSMKHLANLIQRMPHLKKLALSTFSVDEKLWNELIRALPRTKIEILDFSDIRLQEDTIKGLARILPRTNIQKLFLDRTGLTPYGVEALAYALPRTKLDVLSIADNDIGEAGIKALANTLSSITTLFDLNLSNCHLNQYSLDPLITILPRTSIRALRIKGNGLQDRHLTKLFPLLHQTRIVTLDLSRNELTSNSMDSFFHNLARPESILDRVALSHNPLGTFGWTKIAMSLPHTRLSTLHLENTQGKEKGIMAFFRVLPRAPFLRELRMTGNEVSPLVIINVASLVPWSYLSVLDLRGSAVGAYGLLLLKKAIRTSRHRTMGPLSIFADPVG
jgi:Ran GTPase-activating protein (RanGAP) involved in mRNA processing and transport